MDRPFGVILGVIGGILGVDSVYFKERGLSTLDVEEAAIIRQLRPLVR